MMKRAIIIALVLLWTLTAFAQRPTNNPYSRFGVGELYYQGFGQNRAMGHTGIASYSNFYFSKLNPASYSAIGRNHVIFSFAFNEKFNEFQTQDSSIYSNVGDFSHLAAVLPINGWLYFSLGILPYSGVGYNIVVNDSLSDGYDRTDYATSYDGSGGINQGYLGFAIKPLRNLSLGTNFYYRWGTFDRHNLLALGEDNYINHTTFDYTFINNGFAVDFGGIFNDTIIDKEDRQVLNYSIGAIYSPPSRLRGVERRLVTRYIKLSDIESFDTLAFDTLQRYDLPLASSFGFGISLKFRNQLLVQADYYQENWQGMQVLDMKNILRNSQLIAFGLQYCRDPYSTIYLNRMRFRLGGYIHKTYLDINGVPIDAYAVTLGLGLPAKSAFVNLSIEMGTKGTLNNNLFKENFILINLDLTMHDIWFLKRKFK